MSSRGSRTAWALGLTFVLGIAVARAQRVESVPQLEDVGITEHLNDVVPLDVPLRDERGEAVTLGRYFVPGRPVILNLVYFRCPMLCDVVMDGMVRGLKDVDWNPGTEFQVVTVSIDPTDTPTLAAAKKQDYVARYGREGASEGWHFLTGGPEAIAKLAAAVGFRYRYLEDRRQYAHAAAIFVLTPDGRLSRYLYGVQFEPRTLRLALVEASEGRIGTTLDRFILYCFHYDAESGRYTPAAFKIMRLGGILTVAVMAIALAVFWRREARRRSAGSHPDRGPA